MLAFFIANPCETADKDPPPTTPICYTADLKKRKYHAANDYFIYDTPTFILLHKEKKFLGNYTLFEEV